MWWVKASGAAGKALIGLIIGTPRRQPNLRRLARGRSFRELHPAVSEWMDRHFELIEANAPWLDRIGMELRDYCQGSARPPGLAPGFRVSVVCRRALTVVYGFDGPLPTRLDRFGEALFAAGWVLGARPQWRPNEMLSRPAGMEGTPPWGRLPLSPAMSVTSVSRGEARPVPPPDDLGSRIRGAPRNYLLLDDGKDERHALEEGALDGHEHALTVSINLDYYSNPNAKRRPHRIPRYWLPTRARW
jgi:hypothetical protein